MKVENKNNFAIYLGLLIVAIFLLNYISRSYYGRFDLTDTQMFTISESSKTVLENIDDLLIMKAYFSEDLGSELGNNKRYLQDLLEEYRAVNNEYIDFEFFTSDDSEEFKTEAQKSGIQPVQLNVIENDKMEIKQVFMGMVIMYGDKKESIPVIQTTTGLEYTITSAIKKLINVNKETIGLASLGTPNPQSNNQSISELLRQTYDIMPVNLDTPVPQNISVLILSDVVDSLTTSQYSNLDNYLANGGNLFLAQNRINADIQKQTAEPILSNLFTLLENYGITIKENLALDLECNSVQMRQPGRFFPVQVKYPFLPIIKNFSEDQLIVSGLESSSLLFPSEIDVYIDSSSTEVPIASFTPLFFTSNKSTLMEGFYNLNPIPDNNPIFNSLNEGPFNVAAIGTYQHEETGLSSQIIVVADSRFFADDGGGRMPENLTFTLNSVDYMVGDSDLISLRSREITTRPLNADAQDVGVKSFWKKLNYFLPALLILLFAFFKSRSEKARTHKLEYMYE